MLKREVIVIGAGAAGLMCAIESAKRGRKTTVLEHANKPGKKILMSGGGRCNFTNKHISAENYLSKNRHFCKSALNQYTQHDFINKVESHHIPYFEKTLGQLFCQNKSRDILNMLLAECQHYQAEVKTHTAVKKIKFLSDNHFEIITDDARYHCESLVIATGGLSIPTMGASPFGYRVAEQFNLSVQPTRAGLVPFILDEKQKKHYEALAGVSTKAQVHCQATQFIEGLLFTHKGLSGPSILQISSYWLNKAQISIDLLPDVEIKKELIQAQKTQGNKNIKTFLSQYLPKKLVKVFLGHTLAQLAIKQLTSAQIEDIVYRFSSWKITPLTTEGYRTAEVTLGGVDVEQLSSKTMAVSSVKGLFFIGEVVDVTGWLGGYNFQWAWSSGWTAGQYT